MGQKVHPTGVRLGIIYDWESKWYAKQNYAQMLKDDYEIRKYLTNLFGPNGAIGRIKIERPAPKNIQIVISTARPGVIIGKKGEDIETLRAKLMKMLSVTSVNLRIEEIRKPEIDAKLVAESVAQQLEKRILFRRAMKRAVTNALRAGALGIKICVSGRLGGAEIARSEWYREGRVPLHTFRADIDYGTAISKTTYGIIGVKVWIFKGEVQKKQQAVTSQVEDKIS